MKTKWDSIWIWIQIIIIIFFCLDLEYEGGETHSWFKIPYYGN